MASNLVFYQLLLVALVLICLLIHVGWPNAPSSAPQTSRKPTTRRRKRATDPKPFPGFIHNPLCDACEQALDSRPKAPGAPPPLLIFTRGRRRTVDTQHHCCPAPDSPTTAGAAVATSAPMDILVVGSSGS